jgi:hypothetical protein
MTDPYKRVSEKWMSAPRVVIQADRKILSPITVTAPRAAWRLLGWFGLLLAVVGFIDVALQWYPTSFKSPEWEFATVAATVATLPLLTIGLTVLLASLLARGSRAGVTTMAAVFALMSFLLVAAYLLFLSDVPMALRASTNPGIILTIKKSIIRTSAMALGFGGGYLVAAAVSYRYLSRRINDD